MVIPLWFPGSNVSTHPHHTPPHPHPQHGHPHVLAPADRRLLTTGAIPGSSEVASTKARYVDCGCDCACGKGMLLLPLPASWPSSSSPLPCLPLLHEDAVWEGPRCRSARALVCLVILCKRSGVSCHCPSLNCGVLVQGANTMMMMAPNFFYLGFPFSSSLRRQRPTIRTILCRR